MGGVSVVPLLLCCGRRRGSCLFDYFYVGADQLTARSQCSRTAQRRGCVAVGSSDNGKRQAAEQWLSVLVATGCRLVDR